MEFISAVEKDPVFSDVVMMDKRNAAVISAYWNAYYERTSNTGSRLTPSDFCLFCIGRLERQANKRIVDLGCGNGRDSVAFARSGFEVTSVDQSAVALSLAKNLAKQSSVSIETVQGDFSAFGDAATAVPVFWPVHVYSRFSLHAIDDAAQQSLLENARRLVGEGTAFMIEARTTLEFGEHITGHMERWDGDHYRRYLHVETLKEQLMAAGFEIEYLTAGFHMAVLPGVEDPHVVRVIAR